jgi:sRNA-binding regulator protein Hfq
MSEDRGRPAARRKVKPRVDEAARAKAEQFVKQGMPYQMAMSVAHGRLDLSEALERMARRDRVTALMERHTLSRALATQIALGQADLDQVLARRRLEEHRVTYRDRTCLAPGAELVLVLHDGRTVKGTLAKVEPYNVTVATATGGATPGGTEQVLHKLLVMYAYAPGDWKAVKKAVKAGDRKAEVDAPALRPQDRYTLSDRRLFQFQDGGQETTATLLDGTTIRGAVAWFGRYEFGLRLRGEATLTVFRHALKDLV